MEVELTAMQAAAAHPGGHPTQGAASPQFWGRIPRQELSPLPPSAGTSRGEQEYHPLQSQPHRAEIALQLHSASLVVSPNNSNPKATSFPSATPRHYGQVSPTPSNCLFLMRFLNPFMIINRFKHNKLILKLHNSQATKLQINQWTSPTQHPGIERMYHQGNGGDPSIPWPLDSDCQLSSMTKNNPLKHKDIRYINKHQIKTEASSTGGSLEDKGTMG